MDRKKIEKIKIKTKVYPTLGELLVVTDIEIITKINELVAELNRRKG